MALFLLVTKSSPPLGGAQKKVPNAYVEHGAVHTKISQHPRARNDYDEETAYESFMNPEPGFQSGPGDSVDKTSPPSGGGLRKITRITGALMPERKWPLLLRFKV